MRDQRHGGGRTNHAFDTNRLTEGHLSDPDVVGRFDGMSRAQLMEYRNATRDPAVQAYLEGLIATRPSVPCRPDQIQAMTASAERARVAAAGYLPVARRGLDRVHSAWINHKPDLLAGSLVLQGEPVCAFDSNFNISARDPAYGVRHIRVMSRLRHLASRMASPVAYSCAPEDDEVCISEPDGATQAYVRGGVPPIHFCRSFRDDFDALSQESTVLHEFSHFLPGVTDTGGYANPMSTAITCTPGLKFTAASDVLGNNADALTGFVMNLGQATSLDVRARAPAARRGP